MASRYHTFAAPHVNRITRHAIYSLACCHSDSVHSPNFHSRPPPSGEAGCWLTWYQDRERKRPLRQSLHFDLCKRIPKKLPEWPKCFKYHVEIIRFSRVHLNAFYTAPW